ncbi:MAG: sugar phosphate isomerase/epimerase family protein [Aristaeellaceae bacterium]
MNIGLRLHDAAGVALEDRVRNAKAQGFSCVHIAMSKVIPGFKMSDAPTLLTPELAREVRGILDRYGMRCVLLGCYLNLASPDLEDHARTVEIYKAHLRFAKMIGASLVGTETGAPNTGYKTCPECWTEEALQLFIDRVTPVVRYAEEVGQPFAIEPVCRHIVNTPARCQRVLEAVNSPMLRVILDAVNLLDRDNRPQADAVIADAIARLGDSTDLLHMKDFITENTPACEKAMVEVANTNMFDGLLSIACGLGEMNYAPLLALAKARQIPMTLENTNPDNAEAARLHLEALAAL